MTLRMLILMFLSYTLQIACGSSSTIAGVSWTSPTKALIDLLKAKQTLFGRRPNAKYPGGLTHQLAHNHAFEMYAQLSQTDIHLSDCKYNLNSLRATIKSEEGSDIVSIKTAIVGNKEETLVEPGIRYYLNSLSATGEGDIIEFDRNDEFTQCKFSISTLQPKKYFKNVSLGVPRERLTINCTTNITRKKLSDEMVHYIKFGNSSKDK